MVRFPDVNPTDLPTDLEFSMVAGSYIEIYNEPGNCYTVLKAEIVFINMCLLFYITNCI